MRSRHNTPPSGSPILDDLASILPLPKKTYRSNPTSSDDDASIPLDDLDPETSRLIPRERRRTHRVWVQGRLAAVRSVSRLRKGSGTKASKDGVDPNLVSGIPSPMSPQDGEEDEEAEKETARRARQLRGYGIGGIGNIRRPTDVIYGPNRPASFARSQPNLATSGTDATPPTSPLDDTKWNLRDFLALRADDKGKGRASRPMLSDRWGAS